MWNGPPSGPGRASVLSGLFTGPFNPSDPNSRCFGLCNLRDPSEPEHDKAVDALAGIRHGIEFCGRVQEAGVNAIARGLQVWDNHVNLGGGTGMYGSTPYVPSKGGPVMYLWSAHSRHDVVHEAIHATERRMMGGLPVYHGEFEAGSGSGPWNLSIDATATRCMQ